MFNKIKGISNLLRMVLKYAGLVAVVIEIIQFAIDRLESVKINDKDTSSPNNSGSSAV